ncbi:hypothetical protein Bbelb_021800 [Branchiostoma belcheri]|nr:hypothetical protein Bbelb_021800 [Branchiostoma belcheri]
MATCWSAMANYSKEFLRGLKQAASPVGSELKEHFLKLGEWRFRSRPRGKKAEVNDLLADAPSQRISSECRRGPARGGYISHSALVGQNVITSTPTQLVQIPMSCQENQTEKTGSQPKAVNTHKVPSLFLSNARSLYNKLEEFELRLVDSFSDIATITETWFNPSLPADMTNITGFTTFSSPRMHRTGGGVAVYVKNDLPSCSLDVHVPSDIECTWIKVRSRRLPRNVSCLAVCAVYSPPNSPHVELLVDHLVETIDSLTTKHPYIGVVIGGDFNPADTSRLCKNHNLHQIVNQPTRCQATLVLLFTDLKQYYSAPSVVDPLATSDHNVVLLQPRMRRVSNTVINVFAGPSGSRPYVYLGSG